MAKSPRLQLQCLEPRHAPATFVSATSISFQDADGDAVVVTLNKPVLTPATIDTVFQFHTGPITGNGTPQQLQTIDLTGFTNGLSVTAKATAANGGDGTVNVGHVKADGRDLGNVVIGGDLGRVTAGDPNTKSRGLALLSAGSLGAFGTTTQSSGGNLVSSINGALGAIRIAGDVSGARVQVTGGVDGKIGVIDIGGDLAAHATNPNTGLIDASGSIGRVIIDGDIAGGAGATSGVIAGGNIGPVTIGGSLLGGGTESARFVALRGNIGPVRIAGDIRSGTGGGSASIKAFGEYAYPSNKLVGGRIASVSISGDVVGASVDGASIYASNSIGPVKVKSLNGSADDSASIRTFIGGIGPVTVAGDVAGATGDRAASVISAKGISPVFVGGNVAGGSGQDSASFQAQAGSVGRVHVVGDITGGQGLRSASFQALAKYVQVNPVKVQVIGGRIAAFTVDGDLTGGNGNESAIVNGENGLGPIKAHSITGGNGNFSAAVRSGKSISAVTIGKDLFGGIGDDSASIQAIATVGPVKIGGDLTGGGGNHSATIDGSRIVSVVVTQKVQGGVGVGSAAIVADISIGLVQVGTTWSAASIGAGVRGGADGFSGTADDIILGGGVINKILIGGVVDGTGAAGDHFAFVAGRVKFASVNGAPIPLSPVALDDIDLGTQTDFVLVEV